MFERLRLRTVGRLFGLDLVHGLAVAVCAVVIQGCASVPHRQLESFPTAEELGTPKSMRPHYEEARVDFERAAKGLQPQYAVWRSALYDGGTTFYRGTGYGLTIWKRLSTSVAGQTEVYAGPAIHFSRTLSPRGQVSYSIARTRKLK